MTSSHGHRERSHPARASGHSPATRLRGLLPFRHMGFRVGQSVECQDRNRPSRARGGPAESGYRCDGGDASIEPAPNREDIRAPPENPVAYTQALVHAKLYCHIIQHIADVPDIIGAISVDRNIPSAAVGLQARDDKFLRGRHVFESRLLRA